MEKFTAIKGIAAPMPDDQTAAIDILPLDAQRKAERTGLGKFLFAAERYNDKGRENPAFILNQPAWRKSAILVTGMHFGHGDASDHLFWALTDFGIRVVVAAVFDGAFRAGCYRHGILPIEVSPVYIGTLMQAAADKAIFTADLEKQTLSVSGGKTYTFETPAFERHCLLSGLDDIGLTLEHVDAIDHFEKQHRKEMFWLYA